MQKGYYAVIPASVRYCKDVSNGAKLLYAEITALSNEKGYCWATNSYFSELYSTSERTVSRWIGELARAGFLLTLVDNEKGNSRKIWLAETQGGIDKNVHRVTTKMSIGSRQKCPEGIDKNVLPYKENTKVNIKSEEEKETPPPPEKLFPLKAESRVEGELLAAAGRYDLPAPPPAGTSPAPSPEYAKAETQGEWRRVNIAEEVERMKTDVAAKEAFCIGRKLPSARYLEYLDAFRIDVTGREKKYDSTSDLRGHFLSWSEIHHYKPKAGAQTPTGYTRPANAVY